MAQLKVNNYEFDIIINNEREDLTAYEWYRMFTTAMIGIGFLPQTVYSGMKDYAEEYLEENNC